MGRQSCVSLALFKVLLRLLTKHPIVQFDFNLHFLFLPSPPGDGQWPIKIMMVKISLKNSARITMFTNRDAPDWGLGDQTFVPRAFFFFFFSI